MSPIPSVWFDTGEVSSPRPRVRRLGRPARHPRRTFFAMSVPSSPAPPAGLRSRMATDTGATKAVVTSAAGIPSRRRHRRSRLGADIQVVQRMRCSTWMSAPDLLRGKLADATGYPLPHPLLSWWPHASPSPVRKPCAEIWTHGQFQRSSGCSGASCTSRNSTLITSALETHIEHTTLLEQDEIRRTASRRPPCAVRSVHRQIPAR
jgi:hypothetical protein